MKQDQAKRQHYHAMAVELTIIEHNEQKEPVSVSSVTEQVLLHKSEAHITLKDIKRVQEQAQLNLFAKMQDPTNMVVQNVVILNVSHLGYMTEAEWLDGVELPKVEPKAGLQLVKTDDVMPDSGVGAGTVQ